MSTGQTDYKTFRQRLDTILRQKNPGELRNFLIAEGQWQQSTSNDAEAAMWMMIAASSALADLHDEARHWLLGNGHEAEANAIFGRRSKGGGTPRGTAHPTKNTPQGGVPNGVPNRGEGSRGRSSTPPSQSPRAQHSERRTPQDQKRLANPPKQPKRDPHSH